MKKKLLLLMASFSVFLITSVVAFAVEKGNVPNLMGCTYQYTYCSDDYCARPDGSAGAKGEHVYHCTTPPYVRAVATCCGP